MQIAVTPDALEAAAAHLRADAALLESLLVVARLDAAAAAVPGTELARAAAETAARLRSALFRLRLQVAGCARDVSNAGAAYTAADRNSIP